MRIHADPDPQPCFFKKDLQFMSDILYLFNDRYILMIHCERRYPVVNE